MMLNPTFQSNTFSFKRAFSIFMAILLVIVFTIPSPASLPAVTQAAAEQMELAFTPNLGQSSPSVLYQAHDRSGTIYLTSNEMIVAMGGQTLRVGFVGANPTPAVSASQKLAGVVNYLIGNDASRWLTHLPTYAGVNYQQLYPGIDLHLNGKTGSLKGTYTVAPGTSPSAIRWQYNGASSVSLTGSGDLSILMAGSTLTEKAPVAWQVIAGQRVPVNVSFAAQPDGSFGFTTGSYNLSLPLVIDPELVFGTYLGGNGIDTLEGMTVDAGGNIYVTGTSSSTDFPTGKPVNSGDDIFVTKLAPDGASMIFSTFVGGADDDSGTAIAVDSDGVIYLTGDTMSADFPTKNAYQAACAKMGGMCMLDAYVLQLAATGDSVLYGTFLGGNNWDMGEALAVDAAHNIFVTGHTFSSNLPTKSALQTTLKGDADAFVAQFDPSKTGADSLVYNTYLGGGGDEAGTVIAVKESGEVVVGGTTTSTDFPLKTPFQDHNAGTSDLFVTWLAAGGQSTLASTYLGGAKDEYPYGLVLGSGGEAFLTGNTNSTDFPVLNAFQDHNAGKSDAFIVKFDVSGVLANSTYLGGVDNDYGYAIALTTDGGPYVAGGTSSADFPVKDALYTYGQNGDAFAVKLDKDEAQLLFGTFLGGSDAESASSIAIAPGGHVVLAGTTASADLPTKNPIQAQLAAKTDGFILVLDDTGTPQPPQPPANPLAGSTKVAEKAVLNAGSEMSFTITLHNSGTTDVTATVVDALPAELIYTAGSATNGGVFSEADHKITWTDVTVPASSDMLLTYKVTTEVTHSTAVTNTATITVGNVTFTRAAWVMLMAQTPPQPGDPLAGSVKVAEKLILMAGDEMGFTIKLHNSSTTDVTASVVDTLPAELVYVAGSASNSGVYSEADHKITWTDIPVAAGSDVLLTYKVTTEVQKLTGVTNTAAITVGEKTINRKAWVVLIPKTTIPPTNPTDSERPVVKSVAVGEGDVITDLNTVIHIEATDNVGVTKMFVREWQMNVLPIPHWEVVKSTDGWVPFQAELPWKLGSQNGVHYVGVWTADDANNKSIADRNSLDYANVVTPGATLPIFRMMPYMAYFPKDTQVSITLTATSSNPTPRLYVWYPGNFGKPDQKAGGTTETPEVATVEFTAPKDGAYLILVAGNPGMTYDLEITPAGGKQSTPTVASQAVSTATVQSDYDPLDLLYEPLFSLSSLDPLGSDSATAPASNSAIFLPQVSRP